MALIPVKDLLKSGLDGHMPSELPRHYLGMSQIGEPCDRKLQYYFRWADTITLERRIRRLFDFGTLSEDPLTEELIRLGCEIDGQQVEYVGFAGHWKGHSDGDVTNVPGKPQELEYLLEYKTHNEKNFKELKKNNVQKGFPKQYDQIQRYLAERKGLSGAMYVGYNKNDSDVYIEFIDHDEARQIELKRKEVHIMVGDKLYDRTGTGQITWHECRFCDFKNVCFGKKEIRKGCRTCKHVSVEEDGSWMCTNPGPLEYLLLPTDTQKTGCAEWELDEVFFNG